MEQPLGSSKFVSRISGLPLRPSISQYLDMDVSRSKRLSRVIRLSIELVNFKKLRVAARRKTTSRTSSSTFYSALCSRLTVGITGNKEKEEKRKKNTGHLNFEARKCGKREQEEKRGCRFCVVNFARVAVSFRASEKLEKFFASFPRRSLSIGATTGDRVQRCVFHFWSSYMNE